MLKHGLLAMVLAGACTGCSWFCSPLPGGGADSTRQFADVPPPPDCDLVWSHVYESTQLRYGTMMYSGRPDADEVIDAYKRQMPREDWTYEETVRTAETIMRYRKKKNGRTEHCDVLIGKPNWLGRRYVIVTVTGSTTE